MLEILGNDKRVIGNIELDDYQADAVRDIYSKSYDILVNNMKDQVLLHAPVGSGKTVMGAFVVNFFKRQMSELGYDEPISYIWISPDTGGINTQSKDSFNNILKDVNVLDIQQAKTENQIPNENIMFVNWEKLTKSGNLMKEHTENVVFKDILDNTHNKRVLIIDEAHIDWTNSSDSLVLDIIDADLIINLTATPDKRLLSRIGNDNIIHIPYSVVQDAGFIKNRLVINEGIVDVDYEEDVNRTGSNQIDLLDIEQELIREAKIKREELYMKSIQINGDKALEPLVLIQIPNANALESVTLNYVLEYLKELHVLDDEIAVWLSNDKRNIEDLDNNGVKFLITKQAVSTGWDCPRAHILVKLRETGSINFDIQTIGRVMRIPRNLDYMDDELRAAYIYTPHDTFSYKGGTSDSEKEAIEDLTVNKIETKLKESFVNEIGHLGIPMFKRVRTTDVHLRTDLFYEYLSEYIADGMYLFDQKASVKIQAFDEIDNVNVDEDIVTSNSVVDRHLTVNELKRVYMRDISQLYNIINIEPYISKIIVELLVEDNQEVKVLSFESMESLIYNFYNVNRDLILSNIKKGISEYEYDDEVLKSIETEYEVQERVFAGPLRMYTDNSYSYEDEPDLEKAGESNPEIKFQKFLNHSNDVVYWFRNGVGQDDFSIIYHENGQLKEYYPDFFVFDRNQNLYILDTKADFEDNDFPDTPLKYNEGVSYVKNKLSSDILVNIGLNNVKFSMIKFSKEGDGITPWILLEDEYSSDINDWVQFESILNK